MDRPQIIAVLVVLIALPLIFAPLTMADWGEQASFSVEPITATNAGDQVPIIEFASLSDPAQSAVHHAIASPDNRYVIYGREDFPDRFVYSDSIDFGQGLYDIRYQDQYYRLTTYAAGGFPFVYWLYELPFIVYGALLAAAGLAGRENDRYLPIAGIGGGVGMVMVFLGPEFDFPFLDPMSYVVLGIVGSISLGSALLIEEYLPRG